MGVRQLPRHRFSRHEFSRHEFSRQRFTGRGARLASLAVLALSVAVLPGTGATAGQVSAAAGPVYDISWPQCRAQGGVQPMPPVSAGGLVIGLTNGRPFTRNACLADQAAWAGANGQAVQVYTMSGYPTAAQLSSYAGAGPWRATTTPGRLRNVGYAQARYALDTLTAAGLRPGMVWIDVEQLSAQPWPTGTAAARTGNRYVLEGLMRGLRDAGKSYGLYASANTRTVITGTWWLPGVPAWNTVGQKNAATAQAACSAAGVFGGRALLAQWFDPTYDYDVACVPFSATVAQPPAPQAFGDLDGDGAGDLLARQTTGRLWRYPGNAAGGWQPRRQIATGWQGMDVVDAVGDLSGDGRPDVVAREKATGKLWLYPGDGRGGLGARTLLGTGWQAMDAVVGVGDVTGDGIGDVVGRDVAAGRLWVFPGTGHGTLRPRTQVGIGWHMMDLIVATGDLTGDGIGDMVAREKATGKLWLYAGRGTLNGMSTWAPRKLISSGWSGMDAITGVGDLTRDGVPDLAARERGTGVLWIYPGNGSGGWQQRIKAGTGWQSMGLLS
jgi:hypothetical protein